MLIRFTVANFMSFKEKTEFNFLTAEEVTAHPNHVFKAENGLELTRFAALYGANGSGKSNLVKAMQVFQTYITTLNGRDNRTYYRFAEGYDRRFTNFEIECFLDNRFWIYGINTIYGAIAEEWLLETFPFEEKVDSVIFRRYGVAHAEWGNDYQEIAEKYESMVFIESRPTLLEHLSKGRIDMGLKNSIFQFISNWVFIFPNIHPLLRIPDLQHSFNLKVWIENLLSLASIKRLAVVETYPLAVFRLEAEYEINKLKSTLTEGEGRFLDELPYPTAIYAQKVNGEILLKRLVTVHQPEGQDQEFEFELYQESDGTRRILELAMETYGLVDAEANNPVPRLLIIDEIENSLHVHLIRHMLYALSRSTELKGQLLFTTHDTHLLDPRLFRPDEIWFAKKNGAEATELYPMSDIKLYEGEDWEISYLAGRFGGIPNPIAFI
jgi:AAA15 family ATPase/GTPase